MTEEIQKIETEIVKSGTITPMTLIATAQSQDVSIEKMQQLFELQMRWEDNEAKKDYNEAIALFKSEALSIRKDGGVGYETKDGAWVGYKFATLANIVDKTVPLMSKHGISHSWETRQESNTIIVSCKLSHRGGHSESITLSAPPDSSGKKNNIQAIGSTISYLQRYTLQSILGLAAADQDDDGQGANEPERDPAHYISESQVADIYALLSELGVDEVKFLAWCRVGAVEDIPHDKMSMVVEKIESKRGAK